MIKTKQLFKFLQKTKIKKDAIKYTHRLFDIIDNIKYEGVK